MLQFLFLTKGYPALEEEYNSDGMWLQNPEYKWVRAEEIVVDYSRFCFEKISSEKWEWGWQNCGKAW